MNYASKLDKAIFELSKFKVQFSETNQSYLFNNRWAYTCTESYFKEQFDHAKSLLHIQLKNGLNHKEYLQNLLDNLGNRIDNLDKNRSNSPDFFENNSIKIVDTATFQQVHTSNKNNYERFLKNHLKADSSEDLFFGFLKLHEERLNGYASLIDFEKGQLLYTIMLYRDALTNLNDYINSIHSNIKFIDFKSHDFENSQILKSEQKNDIICDFNLDKKKIAHLFRILIEEKLVVFNELNYSKNLLEMKKFVEQNFTFLNNKNKRAAIETFNREYSEVKSPSSDEVKKHKAFIDELILILENRKANLKD